MHEAMTWPAEGQRPETAAAVEAATRALNLASRTFGLARAGVNAGDIRFKGGREVVTAADIAAEDTIRDILGTVPGTSVVGEERGGEPPADGSPYWLVDPICGTRNFASGIPLYCVNLALVENGEITVAVVGDASTGEISFAEWGGGAWVLREGAGRRVTTSAQSRTTVIEDGRCRDARRERAARYTAAAIRADRWDLRSLGTSLSLPYVAAGRIAAYVLFWVSVVHIAAGSLLAAEAGACVSDIDGQPWTIESDSIVASAGPALHQELLTLASGT